MRVKVKGSTMYLVQSKYYNGALTVSLEYEGSPYTTISVNLSQSEDLPKGVFYGKHWSENEGILEELTKQGAIEVATDCRPSASGFISQILPYRIMEEK